MVPELIQSDMTADKLAAEALLLLENNLEHNNAMRGELALVAGKLSGSGDPMEACH